MLLGCSACRGRQRWPSCQTCDTLRVPALLGLRAVLLTVQCPHRGKALINCGSGRASSKMPPGFCLLTSASSSVQPPAASTGWALENEMVVAFANSSSRKARRTCKLALSIRSHGDLIHNQCVSQVCEPGVTSEKGSPFSETTSCCRKRLGCRIW